jgi:RNA polymerase sigma-70 factor (ECF subfamily)
MTEGPAVMIPEIRAAGADAEADDAAIITESLGQPERFAVIFDRYFSEVHRYVERRLGTEAADEVASDTFLVAFGKRDQYRSERLSARPWLYGIATNLIGKHRRRSGSAFRAHQRAGLADVAERYDDQVAERVSAQQRRAELTRALAGLPSGERDVLLLVALAEFSHDEVAQALGISYGTVASRLSRARAKLRRCLATDPAATDKE